jgi:hypothetical protein
MTDSAPALKRGDEYIVFYTGGPYDGRTDTRISTDGGWDDEVTVLAAVDGKETQLVYGQPVVKKIGEQVQVHYSWEEAEGEEPEDPEERNDI